jgi:hypothetical protein
MNSTRDISRAGNASVLMGLVHMRRWLAAEAKAGTMIPANAVGKSGNALNRA